MRDSGRRLALSRMNQYGLFQGLASLASALWLGFFGLFLLEGLGCTPLQVGLIFAWGFIAQVVLEVPTGVLADAFSHRLAVLSGFALLLVYSVIYLALFSAHLTLSLDSWLIVAACMLAEFVGALAVTLQSGALEAWASEPIRTVSSGQHPYSRTNEAQSWYASLETSAKRMIAAGLLCGGSVSFGIMAAATLWHPGPIQEGGTSPAFGLPWLLSAPIYLLLFLTMRRAIVPGSSQRAAGERYSARRLLAAFRRSFDRIIEISIDFFSEDERGRTLFHYMVLNAVFHFGVVTIAAFWSISVFESIQRTAPDTPRWLVFLLLAFAWGAISSVALLASTLAVHWRQRLPNSKTLYASLFFLMGLTFCGISIVQQLQIPREAVALLLLLAFAKLLEGVGRPSLAALFAISLPDSRTRATLHSLQGWSKSVVAGLLFVGLGVVAQKGFELVWLYAGGILAVSPLLVWSLERRRSAGLRILVFAAGLGCAILAMSLALLPSPVSFQAISLEQHAVAQVSAAGDADDLILLTFGLDASAIHESSSSRDTAPFTLDIRLDSPANSVYWHRPFGEDASGTRGRYAWTPGLPRDPGAAKGVYHFETSLPATIEFNVSHGVAPPAAVQVRGGPFQREVLPRQWLNMPEDAIVASMLVGSAFFLVGLMARAVIRSERRDLSTSEKLAHLGSLHGGLRTPAMAQEAREHDPFRQLREYQADRDTGLFSLLEELRVQAYLVSVQQGHAADDARLLRVLDAWPGSTAPLGHLPSLCLDELDLAPEGPPRELLRLSDQQARIVTNWSAASLHQVPCDVLAYRFPGASGGQVVGQQGSPAGVVFFILGDVHGQTLRERRSLQQLAHLLERTACLSLWSASDVP